MAEQEAIASKTYISTGTHPFAHPFHHIFAVLELTELIHLEGRWSGRGCGCRASVTMGRAGRDCWWWTASIPPPTIASIFAVLEFVTFTTISVGAGRISVAYCEPRRSMVTPPSTTEMRPMAPVSVLVVVVGCEYWCAAFVLVEVGRATS